MRIVIMSDVHLSRKTEKLRCALQQAGQPDLLLIAGDLADRGQEEQYDLLRACIREQLGDTPVYCVAGNHDQPARDDRLYRAFERSILQERHCDADESGAFYANIGCGCDLTGLNPVYHQKIFFFPEKGRQLHFLETRLRESGADVHIVLCHPPLMAHGARHASAGVPYIASEQDARLQEIVNRSRNVIFLSGHTHLAPCAEMDEIHHNLYISCGSLCPTETGCAERPLQQGNITVMEVGPEGIHLSIQGIHTGREFFRGTFPMHRSQPFSETNGNAEARHGV